MDTNLSACPICGMGIGTNKRTLEAARALYKVTCSRCGTYKIADLFVVSKDLIDKLNTNKGVLSSYVRMSNSEVTILPESIDELINKASSAIGDKDNIEEKANLLIRLLKERTESFGDSVALQPKNDCALIYAKDAHEVGALISFLEEQKLVVVSKIGRDRIIRLTAGGFNLAKRAFGSRQIFIAQPFSAHVGRLPESYWDACIDVCEKAIRATGKYTPQCIKEETYKEPIFIKALAEIRKSCLVVANLSESRRPVIYEVGYANALDIPILQVQRIEEKAENSEFYTSHYRIHYYSDLNELQEIVQACIGEMNP